MIVEKSFPKSFGKTFIPFKKPLQFEKGPLDISSVNNILYFASKSLKWILEKNNMKSGPSNMALVFLKHGPIFASRYFKRTFEKMSHDIGFMKYGPGIEGI